MSPIPDITIGPAHIILVALFIYQNYKLEALCKERDAYREALKKIELAYPSEDAPDNAHFNATCEMSDIATEVLAKYPREEKTKTTTRGKI